MPHLPIKNSFKNQGLAIFVTSGASFGKRFGKKKLFKINEMPQMARMTHRKWRGGEKACKKRKKRAKENVNEM